VDERLSEMAEIDETIAALRVAAESPARPSEEVVTGMVGKLSEPRERRPLMRSEDTVEVGIFHETEQAGLQGELKKLRRRKREIQDELLQINIENRIALSESAEATLLAEGII
jgi:hypothetical protein